MDIDVSTLISGAALIVSLVVFWRTSLRGFRPRVHNAGRLTVGNDPFAGLTRPFFAVDIIFSNEGASTGTIADVALVLKTQDSSFVCRSFMVSLDRRKRMEKELKPPEMESFASFDVSPGESLTKQIGFIPLRDVQTPLIAGHYDATIMVRKSNRKGWKKCDSFPFEVSDEDLVEIGKSKLTEQPGGGFYVEWRTRDKVTQVVDRELEELKRRSSQKKS